MNAAGLNDMRQAPTSTIKAAGLLTAAAIVACASPSSPSPPAEAAVFFNYHGDRRGTFGASSGTAPDTARGPFAAAFLSPTGELFLCAAQPRPGGVSTLLLLNLGVVTVPTDVTLPPVPLPGAPAFGGSLIFGLSPDHSSGDPFSLLQGLALITSVTADSVAGVFWGLFTTPNLDAYTTAYSTSTSDGHFTVPRVSPTTLPHICGT